eukprot:gene12954-biopygen6284
MCRDSACCIPSTDMSVDYVIGGPPLPACRCMRATRGRPRCTPGCTGSRRALAPVPSPAACPRRPSRPAVPAALSVSCVCRNTRAVNPCPLCSTVCHPTPVLQAGEPQPRPQALFMKESQYAPQVPPPTGTCVAALFVLHQSVCRPEYFPLCLSLSLPVCLCLPWSASVCLRLPLSASACP